MFLKQSFNLLSRSVKMPCVQNFSSAASPLIDEYIKIGDQRIHVVKKGSGERNILLMPGALGSAKTDFGPQLQGLDGDRFTVIGWDPPGYGESRPQDRNFDNFFYNDAEMAAKTMTELGIEKYSLMGWSDGGITALILAAKHQKKVDKLVIWGSNAYVCKSDIDMIHKVADVSAWSARMRQPMEEVYGDKFPQLWAAWVGAYTDIYTRGGDICVQCLQNIMAPSLIIHGMKDVMVAEEHVHHMAENIKNSTKHIWEGGKHNLHLKHSEEFNKLVQDFILQH